MHRQKKKPSNKSEKVKELVQGLVGSPNADVSEIELGTPEEQTLGFILTRRKRLNAGFMHAL